MLPLTTNIKEAYNNGRDDEQKFIQNLSLFLCTFLKDHGQLIEAKVEKKLSHLSYMKNLLARLHFCYMHIISFAVTMLLDLFNAHIPIAEFCYSLVLEIFVKTQELPTASAIL